MYKFITWSQCRTIDINKQKCCKFVAAMIQFSQIYRNCKLSVYIVEGFLFFFETNEEGYEQTSPLTLIFWIFHVNQAILSLSTQWFKNLISLIFPPSINQTEPFLAIVRASFNAIVNSDILEKKANQTKCFIAKLNSKKKKNYMTHVCCGTCVHFCLASSNASSENALSFKSSKKDVSVIPGQIVMNLTPYFLKKNSS